MEAVDITKKRVAIRGGNAQKRRIWKEIEIRSRRLLEISRDEKKIWVGRKEKCIGIDKKVRVGLD